MEIRDLASVGIEVVLDAFQQAFGDYAVNFDRHQVSDMLVRRGYRPELSFAFFKDDVIVAFVLNGVGKYAGIHTCYDCGTGTLPEFRGRGLAGRLFAHSLNPLRHAGVRQYVLEVLCENAPAISVYRKAGFEVTAEYDCFNGLIAGLHIERPLSLDVDIHPVAPDSVQAMPFCDFAPSWQNDYESICRGAASLTAVCAYFGNEPVGYCVFDRVTGDIACIAVRREYRRQGVATALIRNVLSDAVSTTAKVLNVAKSCESMHEFLAALNFSNGLSQYEMRLKLD